jgi:hypothetical protein
MDQRNQEDHLPKGIDNCPATLDWWEIKSFHSFYQVGIAQDGFIIKTREFITRINCDEKLPKSITVGKEEICDFRDQTWKKLPLTFDWKKGHFSSEDVPQREHWHTSISLQNHWLHIDYVSLAFGSCHCYGREYHVFFDGHAVGRGGGYLGYMMAVFGGLRNLPLMTITDEYLIYLPYMLQRFGSWISYGEINPEEVLSIWRVV